MSTKAVALITGANKGIGFAIARQLGAREHVVWIGCRDHGRGEKAAADLRAEGIDAHSIVIDVTNDASVHSAAARLGEASKTLDVLVNNAGISLGSFAPASTERIDDIRAMFEVNAFGPVRVTQAFLPLLRRAKAPRIVMMSSGLGSLAATVDMSNYIWNVGVAGYCASKSALNMFTIKLAKELSAEGIKVNSADPGYTATDLNNHTGHRSVEEAAVVAIRLATLGPLGPTGGFFHDGHASEWQHPW
jgi:NAD(P)-dependent dehydrogenase (short-subunit alcohol dehydrogenase family)